MDRFLHAIQTKLPIISINVLSHLASFKHRFPSYFLTDDNIGSSVRHLFRVNYVYALQVVVVQLSTCAIAYVQYLISMIWNYIRCHSILSYLSLSSYTTDITVSV